MSAVIKHNGVEYRVEGDEWGLRRCEPEPGDDATYEAIVDLFCAWLARRAGTRGAEAMPGARAYEAWKESRNIYAA